MKALYPYLNRALKSLEGEEWRDMPGDFKGTYKISSYGRVMSMPRTCTIKNGRIRSVPERILACNCSIQKNKTVGDVSNGIMVQLSADGLQRGYSVARLVYYTFVRAFDLSDKSIKISCRDGDGRNLYYRNLIALNLSNLLKQNYKRGRAKPKGKPISQFDTKGNLVAQYPSISHAAKAIGGDIKSISDICVGKGRLHYGYVWQRGYAKKLKPGKLPKRVKTASDNNTSATESNSGLPSENPGLNNIPGEIWKDIPGYEELYCISNFGRVKAKAKVSEGKIQKWYPECIKKLTKKIRPSTQESANTTLIATLCKSKRKRTIVVARYVFHLFVAPIDLDSPSLRIRYKDNNSQNLHYQNLRLTDAARTFQS